MIDMAKSISLGIVLLIGFGGLLIVMFWVWQHAFNQLLIIFKVKKAFAKFVFENYRKNRPR